MNELEDFIFAVLEDDISESAFSILKLLLQDTPDKYLTEDGQWTNGRYHLPNATEIAIVKSEERRLRARM